MENESKAKSKGNFNKKEQRELLKALGQMSQIGFTIITCVALGFAIGLFLDNRLGTAPVFLIIFSLLGCASAIKAMVDLAKKF